MRCGPCMAWQRCVQLTQLPRHRETRSHPAGSQPSLRQPLPPQTPRNTAPTRPQHTPIPCRQAAAVGSHAGPAPQHQQLVLPQLCAQRAGEETQTGSMSLLCWASSHCPDPGVRCTAERQLETAGLIVPTDPRLVALPFNPPHHAHPAERVRRAGILAGTPVCAWSGADDMDSRCRCGRC